MNYYFGATDHMRELESKAQLIARSAEPVLIEGETGTGKESLAIHLHALRAGSGQFLKVLCDSSGLDGKARLEQLRQTGENTLLLKRVDRLSSQSQERILVILEQGKETPRLISTTSESLERISRSGGFAPELLFRLSAYRMSLPPLRDRLADIPELFQAILADLQEQAGIQLGQISSRLLDALVAYSWPGNIRELQNVARSYLLTPDPAALAAEIEKRSRPAPGRAPAQGQPALKERVREASKKVEGEIILRTLEKYHWNRRRAADSLNISYRSLLYKMKNCNLRNTEQLLPLTGKEL